MGNSKGFTMIELLVAGMIAAILMAIVGIALIETGRFGGQLTQNSAARENLYTALEMIRQDIIQAGTGISGLDGVADSDTRAPRLALFVDGLQAGAPSGWDKLYLSYNKYLRPAHPKHEEGDPPTSVAADVDCDDPANPDNPSYFCHRAWRQVGVSMPDYDSNPDTVGDPAVLTAASYTNPRVGPYDIGYLIGEDGVITLDPADGLAAGDWDGTFGITGTAPNAGFFYAPAVGYECRDSVTGQPCAAVPGDNDQGALVRNVAVNNKQTILFGGDPALRVTKFRVKLWYSGTTATHVSEPEPRPNSDNSTFDPANDDDWRSLRMVEVRVFYQVKGADGKWQTDGNGNPVELTAVMRAVPRGMVLEELLQ